MTSSWYFFKHNLQFFDRFSSSVDLLSQFRAQCEIHIKNSYIKERQIPQIYLSDRFFSIFFHLMFYRV